MELIFINPVWQFVGAMAEIIGLAFAVSQIRGSNAAQNGGTLRTRRNSWFWWIMAVCFLVLAILRFSTLLWWSPLGWLLSVMQYFLGLVFLLTCIFGLFWLLRHFDTKQQGTTAQVHSSKRKFAGSALLFALTFVVFGDHLIVSYDKQHNKTDTFALISIEDNSDMMSDLAVLCNDSILSQSAHVRFICPRAPSQTLDLGGRTPLQQYVNNRGLAGAIWFHNSSPTEATSGFPFQPEFAPSGYSPSTPETGLNATDTARMVVLEYISLMYCQRQNFRAVLKLSYHWHEKYLNDYWPPKDYPKFLRCYIEAAYDSYEGLVLDPYIADLISAIGQARQQQESVHGPYTERALYTLAYVRLLLRNGQYTDAEKMLKDLDGLVGQIDNEAVEKPLIRATIARLLGETYLARYQLEPDALEDWLAQAAGFFDQARSILDSPLVHYGLGRTYFAEGYFQQPPSERAEGLHREGPFQKAVEELLHVPNSGFSTCLEQNARLWLGAAYALVGNSERSAQAEYSINSSSGCDFGLNIQTPVVVTGSTISVTVVLPASSANYTVMTRDYGDQELSSPLSPEREGSPIHVAQLHLPGKPWPPPRFVYYATERTPHLALQKVIQLQIWRADRQGTPDIFPVVLSSDVQLVTNVSSPRGGIIQPGDVVTLTAFISATLPGTVDDEPLMDTEILERLEFCLKTEEDARCKPTQIMQGPDLEGRYQAAYLVDHASEYTMVVSVSDKATQRQLLAKNLSFSVATPSPPTPTPDRRKFLVGITTSNVKTDRNHESEDRKVLRRPCALVIVEETGEIDNEWYRVHYFEDGNDYPGWVPATSTTVMKEFTSDELPLLALTTTQDTPVFHDVDSMTVAYVVGQCTLVEIVDEKKVTGDQPRHRYKVRIYENRGSEPAPGWMNATDVDGATLAPW